VCSQAILHVCLHVFCGCLIEFLYPIFQILHAQSGMQMDRCTSYTPKPTYHPPLLTFVILHHAVIHHMLSQIVHGTSSDNGLHVHT
jgi:hypothetical protein